MAGQSLTALYEVAGTISGGMNIPDKSNLTYLFLRDYDESENSRKWRIYAVSAILFCIKNAEKETPSWLFSHSQKKNFRTLTNKH